jgi:hypothetical protein
MQWEEIDLNLHLHLMTRLPLAFVGLLVVDIRGRLSYTRSVSVLTLSVVDHQAFVFTRGSFVLVFRLLVFPPLDVSAGRLLPAIFSKAQEQAAFAMPSAALTCIVSDRPRRHCASSHSRDIDCEVGPAPLNNHHHGRAEGFELWLSHEFHLEPAGNRQSKSLPSPRAAPRHWQCLDKNAFNEAPQRKKAAAQSHQGFVLLPLSSLLVHPRNVS